jgi:hypothetical protein
LPEIINVLKTFEHLEQCIEILTDREETSHLYAFCQGLTQIRMRLFGKTMFEDRFEWSPKQLLNFIKEVDKICPEEGHPNTHS